MQVAKFNILKLMAFMVNFNTIKADMKLPIDLGLDVQRTILDSFMFNEKELTRIRTEDEDLKFRPIMLYQLSHFDMYALQVCVNCQQGGRLRCLLNTWLLSFKFMLL